MDGAQYAARGALPGGVSHVVWDWNGTLLDDVNAVVEATTAAFSKAGIVVPVTGESYRRSFTRPIKLFYERLLGRPVTAQEWAQLDHAFHDEYGRLQDRCELAAGAREVLTAIDARGWSQSICSMLPEELLAPAVEQKGIAGHFVRIDGLRGGERGGAKLEHLVAHLDRLGVTPSRTVLVGDTVDDATAACGAGIACILYHTGNGLHEPSDMLAVGVPVAASMREALALLTLGVDEAR